MFEIYKAKYFWKDERGGIDPIVLGLAGTMAGALGIIATAFVGWYGIQRAPKDAQRLYEQGERNAQRLYEQGQKIAKEMHEEQAREFQGIIVSIYALSKSLLERRPVRRRDFEEGKGFLDAFREGREEN